MIDIKELENIIDKNNIFKDEPMSKHTSFKIGGKVDYFVKLKSEKELIGLLQLVKKQNIPFYIIGNGTNILVTEKGIRGIVAKLEFDSYKIKKQDDYVYLTVGCGMSIAKLAIIALENELTGMENISGIPGTIGGAIRMNAGSFGKEMKDIVVCSKCMNRNGEISEIYLPEHEFGYRKSIFSKNGLIILETTIKLYYGNKAEIKEKMDEYRNKRIKNQPLEFPNAGSTFKRNNDIPVAKLIDECGLKGYRIGGAEVSTKHAGFIINSNHATANDILKLVEYVQKEVKSKFDIDIELEIIVLGEK